MTDNLEDNPYDVVVVGGGPAGLQGALTLGRSRRRVLVVDGGECRNRGVSQMHNFLTHDGDDPAKVLAFGRAELEGYPTVEYCQTRVSAIEPDGDIWRIRREEAADVLTRKVLLATGLRDTLPDTPGLDELWGDLVVHCPYCDAHEQSGKNVAVLQWRPHSAQLAALMTGIAEEVTLLTEGADIDDELRTQVKAAGIALREEPVVAVRRSAHGATVELADAPDLEVAALFVTPSVCQAAPFAEQLGLDTLDTSCVAVDELGRTSRKGIYAAGDMAHVGSLPMPLSSVLNAATAGLVAGQAADQDLLREDHAWLAAFE